MWSARADAAEHSASGDGDDAEQNHVDREGARAALPARERHAQHHHHQHRHDPAEHSHEHVQETRRDEARPDQT